MANAKKVLAGLFLLAVLLQPIREGIALLRDAATGQLADRLEAVIPDVTPEDYESALGDTLTSVGREEVEAWVGNLLETRFSVPPSGCTVFAACDCTDRTIRITEVRISLHGQYVLQDPHPIEKAVTLAALEATEESERPSLLIPTEALFEAYPKVTLPPFFARHWQL